MTPFLGVYDCRCSAYHPLCHLPKPFASSIYRIIAVGEQGSKKKEAGDVEVQAKQTREQARLDLSAYACNFKSLTLPNRVQNHTLGARCRRGGQDAPPNQYALRYSREGRQLVVFILRLCVRDSNEGGQLCQFPPSSQKFALRDSERRMRKSWVMYQHRLFFNANDHQGMQTLRVPVT